MKKQIVLLSLFAALFIGCDAFLEPEPKNTPEAIFENLAETFRTSYGPFEERQIEWATLYATYRPRVTAATSPDELYVIITEMLRHLDDGHVQLTTPGRPVFNANYLRDNKIDDDLFNLDVIRNRYLTAGYRQLPDNGYVMGRIQNRNIGYIHFRYVSTNFSILRDFLRDNEGADGIIIDLRHNEGGDFTYCFSEMGRLTDRTREVFSSRTKNGPGPQDFTPWFTWRIQPSGSRFTRPIVVLTDRYTISAGERTAMAFRCLPQVTTIGEATCGALSTMIGRELANGWYYTLATQHTRFADGKSYEGVGLPPDVQVKNTREELSQGLDRVLQTAIDSF